MYQRLIVGTVLAIASAGCASGAGGVLAVYRDTGECLGEKVFIVRNLTAAKLAVTEMNQETRASSVIGIIGGGRHEFRARDSRYYFVRRAEDGGPVANLAGHGRRPVTTETVCRPV